MSGRKWASCIVYSVYLIHLKSAGCNAALLYCVCIRVWYILCAIAFKIRNESGKRVIAIAIGIVVPAVADAVAFVATTFTQYSMMCCVKSIDFPIYA